MQIFHLHKMYNYLILLLNKFLYHMVDMFLFLQVNKFQLHIEYKFHLKIHIQLYMRYIYLFSYHNYLNNLLDMFHNLNFQFLWYIYHLDKLYNYLLLLLNKFLLNIMNNFLIQQQNTDQLNMLNMK